MGALEANEALGVVQPISGRSAGSRLPSRPCGRSGWPTRSLVGRGQGRTLLAALPDLSQARARWGKAADGFLTLFGAKLLLPGIADATTLEAVSKMLGEFDRRVISRSSDANLFSDPGKKAVSTQRTRVLSRVTSPKSPPAADCTSTAPAESC